MPRYLAQVVDTAVRAVAVVYVDTLPIVTPSEGVWEPTTDGETQSGDRFDPSWSPNIRFAPLWDSVKATAANPDDGTWWYVNGPADFVFHNGQFWQSRHPVDSPNVWEPPTVWRAYDIDGGYSGWVQPTGAQDAYDVGEVVTHKDRGVVHVWRSTIPANTTKPGQDSLDRWWTDLGVEGA